MTSSGSADHDLEEAIWISTEQEVGVDSISRRSDLRSGRTDRFHFSSPTVEEVIIQSFLDG